MACKACASSFNALAFQTRSKHVVPATAEALMKLRKNKPLEWDRLVRSMRVKAALGEVGIVHGRERRGDTVTLLTLVSTTATLSHKHRYMIWPENRFKNELASKCGWDTNQANAEWAKLLK